MVTIFEVCFYLGAILTLLFFVLGHISDFMNMDGVDVDIDMDMQLDGVDIDGIDIDGLDISGDGGSLDGADLGLDGGTAEAITPVSAEHFSGGSSQGGLLTWLKPNLIILFCTLFGGFGLIFVNNGISPPLAAFPAGLIGLVGAAIINKFLIKLLKNQSTVATSQRDLIGHLGKAALNMQGEQVGYIIYAVNGNTYQSPAKSFEKTPIKIGEDIIIVDIKDNLFYVKKF